MATALAALGNYDPSSDEDQETELEKQQRESQHKIDMKDVGSYLNHHNKKTSKVTKSQVLQISQGKLSAAPDVVASDNSFKYGVNIEGTIDANRMTVDPNASQVDFNPTYDQLFKGAQGPARPRGEKMIKNIANGWMEGSNLNHHIFEEQRRQFAQFDKLDKKTAAQIDTSKVVKLKPHTTVNRHRNCAKPHEKRKRVKNEDPSDLENFTSLGWAEFDDQVNEQGPSEQDREILDEYLVKLRKRGMKCRRMHFLGRNTAEDTSERFEVHVNKEDECDYQGREWWDIDQIKTKEHIPMKTPIKCYMPKKMIHKYIPPVEEGGKKGITQVRMSPKQPHLFFSAGFDGVARVFRLYGKRQLRVGFFK